MTQLFIGDKAGVGPVVKVLKNNSDDPLTLANDAYDRYYYNSETQQLSYVGNAKLWERMPSTPTGVYYIDGNINTGKYVMIVINNSSIDSTIAQGKLKNIFADGFVGIPETRVKQTNGRFAAGKRTLRWFIDSANVERGLVTSYQFPAALGRIAEIKATPAGVQTENAWHNGIYPLYMADRGFNVGDWVSVYGSGYGNGLGSYGRNRPTGATTEDAVSLTTVFWDLPANSDPMPTYTTLPNKETLVLSQSAAIMSRPGFSVSESSGTTQRIFDSTINPSMCILSGETNSIPAGSFVTIPAPNGLTLSEHTIVDMMVKGGGQPQYIPPFVPSGYMRNTWLDFSYKINPNNIQIYNDGSEPVIVRYLVFDADMNPPSTGGNQIMLRGNDGTQDYIQIKRPGTSDPASRVTDIILDTRFPMLQIVKEGFIPISQFSSSGTENSFAFGNVQHTVNFTNNGFMPFIKYTVVCPHVCLSPVMSQAYNYNNGVASWGPPSNQSALCRLTDTSAKFWLSPGNWSSMNPISPYEYQYGLPDPIGIRYYIFGIAKK